MDKPNVPDLEKTLEYIDDIDWAGIDIPVMGAQYVEVTFGLEPEVSRKAVSYWAQTYAERHPHG